MQKEMQKVLKEMEEVLDYSQLAMLQQSMIKNFSPQKALYQFSSNEDYMEFFLKSKKLEGCSDQTIYYYRRFILILFCLFRRKKPIEFMLVL